MGWPSGKSRHTFCKCSRNLFPQDLSRETDAGNAVRAMNSFVEGEQSLDICMFNALLSLCILHARMPAMTGAFCFAYCVAASFAQLNPYFLGFRVWNQRHRSRHGRSWPPSTSL